MASSGSFNTSGYEGRYLKFSWTEKSQSVANNTTTISWTLKGAGTGKSGWYMAGNISLYIDGKKVYSRARDDRFELWNGTTVASGTHTFTHNADGTRTFTASAGAGIYTYDANCSGSGTFTLDTIPRASQPSCITYPEHTQNVGEFGATISVHMNRHATAFTHTVRYAFGSASGTCINAETGKATNKDVGTGFKWKIPKELMDLIPAATSGSGTIYVDTYNGTTLIGTKSCGFTATVPASVQPSCSLTLEDTTGIDDIYGSPVKGLSKIKITVNANTAHSSPIASYSITANGKKYSTTTATTDFLNAAGTSKVTATVTDKRGRKGSASYDMTVQDYTPPAVTALSLVRCNEDGTRNKRGSYVKATFSAVVSSMNGKNTASYTLQYKETYEGSSESAVSFATLKNKFTVTNHTHIFAANINSSFDVSVVAKDRHTSGKRSMKAPTAASVFSWRGFKSSGTTEEGAGIGKVPEKANTLQVGWDAEFEKSTVRMGNSYAFQPDSFSGDKGYTCLAEINLKTLNVNAPIVFVINRRGAICPMTVYVRFASSSSTTDPDLGSIAYDGDNFGAFLVKKATSVWRLYVDNTSGWSNPCLQAWYTTDNQNARLSVSFPSEQISGTEPNVLGTYYRATPAKMQSILDFIYPVGSIYFSYSHVSPASMFGGTWTRIKNTFLWACDENGDIGVSSGEKTHTLTVNELPSHSHGSVYSGTAEGTKNIAWLASGGDKMAYGALYVGGGAAHNNMPPYIHVSVWRRTA